MKVKEILFDDKEGMPIFVLENGEKRVPHYWPTGSCWTTSWISEEEAKKLKAEAEHRAKHGYL